MISLRQLAKTDIVIGSVSGENLKLVADILERRARRLKHPLWRWFYRDRNRHLDVEMVAAAFARVRGVPEPIPAQFDCQVMTAMEAAGVGFE